MSQGTDKLLALRKRQQGTLQSPVESTLHTGRRREHQMRERQDSEERERRKGRKSAKQQTGAQHCEERKKKSLMHQRELDSRAESVLCAPQFFFSNFKLKLSLTW